MPYWFPSCERSGGNWCRVIGAFGLGLLLSLIAAWGNDRVCMEIAVHLTHRPAPVDELAPTFQRDLGHPPGRAASERCLAQGFEQLLCQALQGMASGRRSSKAVLLQQARLGEQAHLGGSYRRAVAQQPDAIEVVVFDPWHLGPAEPTGEQRQAPMLPGHHQNTAFHLWIGE